MRNRKIIYVKSTWHRCAWGPVFNSGQHGQSPQTSSLLTAWPALLRPQETLCASLTWQDWAEVTASDSHGSGGWDTAEVRHGCSWDTQADSERYHQTVKDKFINLFVPFRERMNMTNYFRVKYGLPECSLSTSSFSFYFNPSVSQCLRISTVVLGGCRQPCKKKQKVTPVLNLHMNRFLPKICKLWPQFLTLATIFSTSLFLSVLGLKSQI